jgi:hypothetical protein
MGGCRDRCIYMYVIIFVYTSVILFRYIFHTNKIIVKESGLSELRKQHTA